MRFITFGRSTTGEPRLGVDAGDGHTYVDLAAHDPANPAFTSMRALIDAGEAGLVAARRAYEHPTPVSIVRSDSVVLFTPIRPTVLRDTTLIRTHLRPSRAAMARYLREHLGDPRSFEELVASPLAGIGRTDQLAHVTRDANEITAPGGVLQRPQSGALLDYELEFGVVIGRRGRNVAVADAADYIFGFTIYNDWTLRDVQAQSLLAGSGAHGPAKDFPGGNAIGPCIVTRDEIGDPYDLAMTVRVNGEVWGRGSTRQAWLRWEDAISRISSEVEIHAGEVWGSGTVRDGSSFELGRRLPGSAYVELEIERIGVLSNYVVPA